MRSSPSSVPKLPSGGGHSVRTARNRIRDPLHYEPQEFGTQINNATPEYALLAFALFYLACVGINW